METAPLLLLYFRPRCSSIQARSPRSRPWISTSAVAMWWPPGWCAYRTAAAASHRWVPRAWPPQGPGTAAAYPPRRSRSWPRSARHRPAVPDTDTAPAVLWHRGRSCGDAVATSSFSDKIRTYAVQNCAINSLRESCAIKAILMTNTLSLWDPPWPRNNSIFYMIGQFRQNCKCRGKQMAKTQDILAPVLGVLPKSILAKFGKTARSVHVIIKKSVGRSLRVP